MKIGLIHLSDIHIKGKNDEIISNTSKIYDAIKNELLHLDYVFICVSGDIAYSGLLEEYIVGLDFIEEIQNYLSKYLKKDMIPILVIPGNHDCDFSNEKEGSIRKLLMKDFLENVWTPPAIDNEKVAAITKVQSDFFEFRDNILYKLKDYIIYDHSLLTRLKFKLGNETVIFNLFNSSWFSDLREKAGQMYFPADYFEEELKRESGTLNISLIHHPLHWLHPDNSRPFKRVIEKYTDVILSGHEHDSTLTLSMHPNKYSIQYVEGAALQDQNIENSQFNIVFFDLETSLNKVKEFKWNGEFYSEISDSDWYTFKENGYVSSVLDINKGFREYLNNPGAPFHHPRKKDLYLDDFFIYPDLKEIYINGGSQEVSNITNIKTVIKEMEKQEQWIIIGDKKSGKTTLSKVIFKDLYDKGFFPILFKGNEITNLNMDRFRGKLKDKIEKQYSANQVEKYLQIDKSRKVLLIDDWHLCKMNSSFKNNLLLALHREF